MHGRGTRGFVDHVQLGTARAPARATPEVGAPRRVRHLGVEHSGHYYHENCTSFSTDLCTPRGYYEAAMEDFAERYTPYPWDTDDIRTKAWLALLNQYDSTKLEDEFEEAFKDHMIQLYKNLEKEHDYLTSDEVVWESLEANEMTDELEEV